MKLTDPRGAMNPNEQKLHYPWGEQLPEVGHAIDVVIASMMAGVARAMNTQDWGDGTNVC